MKFGDMICYRHGDSTPHDYPIMYLGKCPHRSRRGYDKDDIEMLGIPEGWIEHKDPAMWQLCTHLAKPSGVKVFIDGKEISDEVVFAGADFAAGTGVSVLGVHDASGTFTVTHVGFTKP